MAERIGAVIKAAEDASGILARTAERHGVQQMDYRAATCDLQELAFVTVCRSLAVAEHFDRRDTRIVKPRVRYLFLARREVAGFAAERGTLGNIRRLPSDQFALMPAKRN